MARTNAHYPDLSVRVTGFKSIASGYFTGIDLEGSRFKVNRQNLTMIAFFNLLAYL
jgi:lipid-binding SYLF domain-containing protein